MNKTEEAILISWRLQQWYEGMVLDPRAMQDLQDAIVESFTLEFRSFARKRRIRFVRAGRDRPGNVLF